jgi:queuine/archaeosine tRNA-ribosyltransferase
MEEPPYTPEDTVEFYADGGFTHGCSIDHIIFEFDTTVKNLSGGSELARDRFDITLELADSFYKTSRTLGEGFTPIGVVQGWSPTSMAEATRRLLAMGYRYLAIGGLVPLKTEAIHQAVAAVDQAIRCKPGTRLHLLGFAKADDIGQFADYRVESFDTTSPLIRAFKDARRNYYLRDKQGRMRYFTAIRIPQAFENNALKRQVKMGRLRQETLAIMEAAALDALRGYSRGDTPIDTVLDAVIDYSRPLHWSVTTSDDVLDKRMETLRANYRRTLDARPWEQCGCPVCSSASVEVIIFRGSNRNKRRGIHNVSVFRQHLQDHLAP